MEFADGGASPRPMGHLLVRGGMFLRGDGAPPPSPEARRSPVPPSLRGRRRHAVARKPPRSLRAIAARRYNDSVQFEELAATSKRVAEVRGRKEKVEVLAEALKRLRGAEIAAGVAFLSGELRKGRIGVGVAALSRAAEIPLPGAPTLSVQEVEGFLERIGGSSSSSERARRLADLLTRLAAEERRFLFGLISGELRQGALEGLMSEAVARATGVPAEAVRRALMMVGRLPEVAEATLTEGALGLARFTPTLFRPVLPMLAQTAEDVGDALARLGTAALEFKLDGARVQVHRHGNDVRVYTRGLHDVTERAPETVELARSLHARELILDGEALAVDSGGRPRPFQVTMRRFGRKLDVAAMREVLPLTTFLFDCLFLDGTSLFDASTAERSAALISLVPPEARVPRAVVSERAAAETFLKDALQSGHEGIMAKSLDAPYEAGARGLGWLKIKPAVTLDLVVLAVEWGHGRRKGFLSNLHLGARDEESGSFVMLGKTFKGLTDEMLAWQTKRLLELEVDRDRWTVYVKAELVVEVAFADLQSSPRYPAGLALRFARVKRYRTDKSAADVDTLRTVRGISEARGVTLPPLERQRVLPW